MRKMLIILGVPIDDLTMEQALARLEEFIALGRKTGKSHQIATVNADFVTKSLDDPELRLILQESDMATADGMPLVWGARLLGVPLEGRVTGADLVPALAERAAQKGYSLYFLGGAPGIAQKAKTILETRYPGVNITGVFSPPVSSVLDMDASIVENIRAAKPDILLVAFGNPKQEKWINMHARDLPVPVMIGVGGTFDFIAGATKRAPMWMQKSGLEWIFRLAQEPKRLWKRYVVDLWGFGFFFVRQWWALRGNHVPAPVLPQDDFITVNDVTIANIAGKLDASNVAPFLVRAQTALQTTPRLIINLERCKFLDSRALGALVGLAKQARDAGGDMYLANVPANLAQTLSLVRLDRFFEQFATVEQAMTRDHTPRTIEPIAAPQNGWHIIATPRRLDTTTASEFQERVASEMQTHPRVILDFAQTVFLASAGMAALLKLDKQAKSASGELRLVNCVEDVARTIRMTRLDTVLTILPTVADATK